MDPRVKLGGTTKSKKYEFERYITVRTQFVGFHKYADAPDEVAFLKGNHRHLFKIEATIQVFHDDRELEFFMVLDRMHHLIIPFTQITGDIGSCEMIAENIATGLINLYGEHRDISVTVCEDGENEGTVVYYGEES